MFKLHVYLNRTNQYDMWMQENEKNLSEVTKLSYNPLISVVVPVYNVQSNMLRECIESVVNQTYSNWELILVDDFSTQPQVRETLKDYENTDRIHVIYRTENGHISKATNTGIEAATGEYIGLMDCDDVLAVNALYEMAKKLNENKEYDFIYSDEDKLSEDGKKRKDPFFKPDWSPDTFMSLMYTCHFSIFRKTLLDELGGLRVGFEGSQDYDLVLRLMEKTDKIGHVAKILYHWRERKESTASSMTAKPYIVESTKKAKEDALERRGLKGHLEWIDEVAQFRVVYEPMDNPKVSIIIPSKDNYDVLKQCFVSMKENTAYENYEIILVDNGSDEENKKLYEELCKEYNARYEYRPMDFNFSAMCNIGAELATGEYFLFLNDDIEIRGSEWLTRLLGQAQVPHTGAVGARLLYPKDNLIQHCGVLNLPIGPGHAFHQIDDSINLYWGRNIVDYNFLVVTGACLMVSKQKYDEIGGFEENLPVAYNDVELCFKLAEKGYFNVIRNDVVMIHHESVSRGYDEQSEEKRARQMREMAKLYEMHPKFKNGYDPCYNPNLVKDRGDFSLDLSKKGNVQEPKLLESPIDVEGLPKVRSAEDYNGILYGIDAINYGDSINIDGWVLEDTENTDVKLLLLGEDNSQYVFETDRYERIDIKYLYPTKRTKKAGISVNMKQSNLVGTYHIYILVGEGIINTIYDIVLR
ncbi:MAG: glycosyltransferase [Lachnospiraceae bacterium]|nr:glycosyltransferase [Lachnospiraceae bacterium]